MDPIEILDKVNSFYSTAFSQLLTITIAILGFGGVVLPIILQIIQSRSFRVEQKSLENHITNEINERMKGIKAEMEKQFQEEKEKINESFKSEIEAINKKLAEQTLLARAGTFFLQGANYISRENYSQAACDYGYAAEMFLSGKDEINGQRALRSLIENCLPKLNSVSFEIILNLDDSIDTLIKTLTEKNENGRFMDTINTINNLRKLAKKKTPPALQTA